MYYLHATIPDSKVSRLKDFISDLKNFPNVDITQLFTDLTNNGCQSIYFSQLKKIFNYFFGNYNQTFLNRESHLIIGNRLDLTSNPNIIVLFYALDSQKDWVHILEQPGQPSPPLSEEQLDQLLVYSLIGASNSQGSYTGTLKVLEDILITVRLPLEFYQLMSLSILLHLNDGIASSTLPQSMLEMISSGNDIRPMQEIIEYSNPNYDADTQNLLLEIGAIFHGRDDAVDLDVYLTAQQKDRIIASLNEGNSITVINGPVKRGLPVGNFQENSFKGFPNITRLPNLNPYLFNQDYLFFGTSRSDELSFPSSSDGYNRGIAMYGGDSNDQLKVVMNFSSFVNPTQKYFIFLAGNEGHDDYWISPLLYPKKYITVYDSDHKGTIHLAETTLNPEMLFQGFVVNGKFNPGMDPTGYYYVDSKTERDGTTSLSFTPYGPSESWQICSYEKGQFGIMPNVVTNGVERYFKDASEVVSTITNETIAIFPFGRNYHNNALYFYRHSSKSKIALNLNYTSISASISSKGDGTIYLARNIIENFSLSYSIIRSNHEQLTQVVDNNIAKYGIRITASDKTNSELLIVYLKNEDSSQLRNYNLRIFFPDSGLNRIVDTVTLSLEQKNPLYAAPIHNGFIISVLQAEESDVFCSSKIYELSSNGDLIHSRTINGNIISTSPINDGYFVLYSEKNDSTTRIFTKSYLGNIWSNTFELSNYYDYYQACSYGYDSPVLQQLPQDMTFIFSPSGNYIFTKENKPILGPSPFGEIQYAGFGNMNKFLASSLLPNNDSLILMSTPGYYQYTSLTLPTSYVKTTESEIIGARNQDLPTSSQASLLTFGQEIPLNEDYNNDSLDSQNSVIENSSGNLLESSFLSLTSLTSNLFRSNLCEFLLTSGVPENDFLECSKLDIRHLQSIEKSQQVPSSGSDRITLTMPDPVANLMLGLVLAKLAENCFTTITDSFSYLLKKLNGKEPQKEASSSMSLQDDTCAKMPLTKLLIRCEKLKQEETQADKWFHYFIEDLESDIHKSIDKKDYSQYTLTDYNNRLRCLIREFVSNDISYCQTLYGYRDKKQTKARAVTPNISFLYQGNTSKPVKDSLGYDEVRLVTRF